MQFLSKIWSIFVYCKCLSALLCFVLFSGILGGFFVLFINLRYIIKCRLSFLEIFLFKICLSDPNYCIILVNYTMLKFRPSFGSKISTYFSVNTIYSFSWGKWNFVLITKSLYQYLGLWNNGSKMITCRSIKWYLDVPSLATLTKKISYSVYIV